jgi:hypothetical protein
METAERLFNRHSITSTHIARVLASVVSANGVKPPPYPIIAG